MKEFDKIYDILCRVNINIANATSTSLVNNRTFSGILFYSLENTPKNFFLVKFHCLVEVKSRDEMRELSRKNNLGCFDFLTDREFVSLVPESLTYLPMIKFGGHGFYSKGFLVIDNDK